MGNNSGILECTRNSNTTYSKYHPFVDTGAQKDREPPYQKPVFLVIHKLCHNRTKDLEMIKHYAAWIQIAQDPLDDALCNGRLDR